MAVGMFLLLTLVLALVMLYTERGEWDAEAGAYRGSDGSGALTPFTDGWAAIYFTIITLSTVGYGDMFPISGWGKTFGVFLILCGTLIIPFPVSIYTESFSKAYNAYCQRQALQTELRAGEDVCTRLSDTLAAQLAEPPLPRFTPGKHLGDHGRGVVPQGMQLRRWAEVVQAAVRREAGVGEGAASAPATKSELDGSGAPMTLRGGDTVVELRRRRAAARTAAATDDMASKTGRVGAVGLTARAIHDPFSEIWGLTAAIAAGRSSSEDAWTALAPPISSPTGTDAPGTARAASTLGDALSPSFDRDAALRRDRSQAPAAPLARVPLSAGLLRDLGAPSLAEAAASRARAEAAAAAGAGGLDETVLCADSFSYADLLQVCAAALDA
jgi:hypothetical protein